MTVHRCQGSQYPLRRPPLTASAGGLLQRNLLYTVVTRAGRGVALAGQATAVHHALANTPHTPGAVSPHSSIASSKEPQSRPSCPSFTGVGQLSLSSCPGRQEGRDRTGPPPG
ncbi:ATP-binding domain-containing protein [Streptomyces asiaticus]|uniref:ATP-binding domain-containing protein n=1 Tax=Streptomyces asiaticus TaxID=114695 RepID=UPI0038134CCE